MRGDQLWARFGAAQGRCSTQKRTPVGAIEMTTASYFLQRRNTKAGPKASEAKCCQPQFCAPFRLELQSFSCRKSFAVSIARFPAVSVVIGMKESVSFVSRESSP